jgi:hypothetical protein
MKFNFTHEKTTFIPVDNQVVQVSSLPTELQNEVETLDRLLQEKIEAIYKLETIELASMVKSSQVQQLVTAYVNQAKAQQAANAEVAKELEKENGPKPEKSTKKPK